MPFNPFDLTKVWPHGKYPLIDVGVLNSTAIRKTTLPKWNNPVFRPPMLSPASATVRTKCYSFAFSPTPMHTAIAWGETMKIYRSIVRVVRCIITIAMVPCALMKTAVARPIMSPTVLDGPVEDAKYKEPPLKCSGDATRYNHRDGNDDYTQPGNLFRLMTSAQRQRLFENIARAMQGVPQKIIARQISHFPKPTPPTAKASNKH